MHPKALNDSSFKSSTVEIFHPSTPIYKHRLPRVHSAPLSTLTPGHHPPLPQVRHWPGSPLLTSPSEHSLEPVPGAESEGKSEASQDGSSNWKRTFSGGCCEEPCRSVPWGPHPALISCWRLSTALTGRQRLGNGPTVFGLQEQLGWLSVSLKKEILLRK